MNEQLQKGLKRYQERLAKGEITIKILNPIEKAQAKPKSLRRAINAKCWDCEGRDADRYVKWRIGNCIVSDCPLYPVRPYQNLFETETPIGLRIET